MNPRARLIAILARMAEIRTGITEVEAIDAPSEDDATRAETLLTEWDELEAERATVQAKVDRLDAVRDASLDPANVERGFEAPNVIVRTDPFEDLDNVRYTRPDDLKSRALKALETSGKRASSETMEELTRKIEDMPGIAERVLLTGSPAYRSAFDEYMRSQGQPNYTNEESAAVRASLSLTSANGGYTLPFLLDPTLIHTGTAVKNPIRDIAKVVTGTANVWHGVTVGNVTSYWVAENTALTDGTPTFGGPAITARKLTSYVTGSYEVFEDSDLQAQLPDLIAESMSYMEQTAFISGDGTSAPKGIVTAISATAGSTVTATTRGSFTSASAVDVFALLNALPSRYESTATWVANKATFNTIKQMSTASQGSFFWTNFNAAIGDPLLGSPIAQSSDMDKAYASGSVFAVLGDFSQFLIYDRVGISVEFIQNVVDGNGLPTGTRGLVAHKRVGSDVTDVNAFRFLKA